MRSTPQVKKRLNIRLLFFVLSFPLVALAQTNSPVLVCAHQVADSNYIEFRYGDRSDLKQVNCVQFTAKVIETLIGRHLTTAERDAVFIRYPISDFDHALKTHDKRMAGVAYAITEVLKIGEPVHITNVQPGDFIQYWMRTSDGSWFGHSAIVARVLRRGKSGAAVSLYGAHKSTDGIAETDFGGTGLDLGGKGRYVFLARVR